MKQLRDAPWMRAEEATPSVGRADSSLREGALEEEEEYLNCGDCPCMPEWLWA